MSLPANGYEWGTLLWKSHPRQFFYLADRISEAADPGRTRRVESGQIWKALPGGACVGLYDEAKARRCPGVIRQGYWEPCAEPVVGPEVLKLVFRDKPTPSLDAAGFRPGLVLGEPMEALQLTDNARRRSLLDYGCAIWIQGRSNPWFPHGQLEVAYPRELGLPNPGYYQMWLAWGVRTDFGNELLCPHSDVRQCTLLNPSSSNHDPHSEAKKLFAEILGLISPEQRWVSSARGQQQRSFERSEVVTIRFSPSGRKVPCIVVSPDDLNKCADVVVVLRCIDYQIGDEHSPLLQPIGRRGRRTRIEGAWSTGMHLVRGITMASKRAEPFDPPIVFRRDDPIWFGELHEMLLDLYA